MRRKVDEIVKKKQYAGFVIEPLVIRIMDLDPDYPAYEEWCTYNCGDEHCKEWCNCEIIRNGKPTGEFVYHVSECQMEDL